MSYPCPDALQAKHAELAELQSSLAADAVTLSEQLASFERNREAAVKELQVCVCVFAWGLWAMHAWGQMRLAGSHPQGVGA